MSVSTTKRFKQADQVRDDEDMIMSFVPDQDQDLQVSSVMRVVVTGAAGQIGYALLPLIASGRMLGEKTQVVLQLLDIPGSESVLEGVKMELEDSSFSLLRDVIVTTNPSVAFQGADVAILLGGFPRKPGMERKELIARNLEIMRVHGKALEEHASKKVRVLVVANPANTNCLVAMRAAPSIPTKNFSALTRLDHERLHGMVARQLSTTLGGGNNKKIRNGVILGNHSSTQVPNVDNAEVFVEGKWVPVRELLGDDTWIDETMVPAVQKRGAEVLAMRKLSSALSAAQAISSHVHDWVLGTAEGHIVSMAVLSDGNPYGVPDDLIFSFPVICKNGGWEMVEDLKFGPTTHAGLDETIQELQDEKAAAFQQAHL